MISIYTISILFVIIYTVSYFLIRKRNNISLYLIFLIFFLPKINIISMGRLTTAGIRIDDFLICLLLLMNYKKRLFTNKYLSQGTKLLIGLTFVNMISLLTGIYIGLNTNILYPFLIVIRKFEYFSMCIIGLSIGSKKEEMLEIIEKEFNRLNLYHAIIGYLQLFNICNYAVSGGESDMFAGLVVSTFNGYYEYGQFLIFALLYYMIKLTRNQKNQLFNYTMFFSSLLLLYYTNSRTSLLCFVILFAYFIFFSESKGKNIVVFKLGSIALAILGVVVVISGVYSFDFGRLANISPGELVRNFVAQLKTASFPEYYQMVKYGIRVTTKLGKTKDLSTSIRFFKWSAAIDGFLRYPLFGYGFGITHVMDGHYIRLLGETGAVGLFAWIYYYTYYVRLFFNNRKRYWFSYFIVLSMISVMISATFIDMFDASKIMEFIWIIVGLGIAQVTKDECEVSENRNIEITKID